DGADGVFGLHAALCSGLALRGNAVNAAMENGKGTHVGRLPSTAAYTENFWLSGKENALFVMEECPSRSMPDRGKKCVCFDRRRRCRLAFALLQCGLQRRTAALRIKATSMTRSTVKKVHVKTVVNEM
ncbi:MAG: hypothetical protein U0M13_08720, partial [Desulfovibrio fairfieldensis]|nr:hypothetical protein [Desulfovibrio fairfieldensis]